MCSKTLFAKSPLITQSYFIGTVLRYMSGNKNLLYGNFFKNWTVPENIQYRNAITPRLRCKSTKSRLDYSKVPKVEESDLVEQFVRGDGPGGQATAKTNNAVVLKHKPTGIVVKCHATRSLWENKKQAREILTMKLDSMINGEDSIENQERALFAKKQASMQRKKKKMAALKEEFKKREGLD